MEVVVEVGVSEGDGEKVVISGGSGPYSPLTLTLTLTLAPGVTLSVRGCVNVSGGRGVASTWAERPDQAGDPLYQAVC